MQITRLDLPKCQVGEGPVWDFAEQALYYIDILEQKVFRWEPATDGRCTWDLPDFLTGHIDPLTGFDNSADGDGSEKLAALFGALAGSPRAAASPGGSVENPFEGQETSRNAPCPCGSGNKYKHCHGALV